MLSLGLLSTPITLSQPPCLFSLPPSKSFAPRNNPNSNPTSCTSNNNNHDKSNYNFRCFFRRVRSSEIQFENIREIYVCQENPDTDFFHNNDGFPSPDSLALWLQSSSSVKDIRRIHAFFLKCSTSSVVYVSNCLVSSYLRVGKLADARKLFDKMPERNVVTWSAIINGHLNYGLDDEALRLFNDSIKSGVRSNGRMFACILNLCSVRLDFDLGRQIHACVIKGNWRNLILDSAIVYFYAQCGQLSSAFVAFDKMPRRDVICWTSLITACSRQGCGQKAFSMFSQMLRDGLTPNEFTVSGILKACGEEAELRFGKQLHCTIVKKIVKSDVYIGTSLVDMYAKCGEPLDSRKVFDQMRNRNTVTWTSIISGYAREGLSEDAINLFRLMKRRNILANNLTIVSILRACGSIRASLIGREVHAQIVKNAMKNNMHIGATLVWFYCKCGEYHSASMVLQEMPFRDVVSWTAIISGCTNLGLESEALEFLKEMVEEGVEPNSYTYSSALKACANKEAIRHGKLIHSSANKTPALSDVFVGSALIFMYAKCGYVAEAFRVFDSMPERNLVSWKVMILGYARNGLCKEALKFMYRMQAEGFEVDDYILATVYSSCADKCDMEEPSFKCLLPS